MIAARANVSPSGFRCLRCPQRRTPPTRQQRLGCRSFFGEGFQKLFKLPKGNTEASFAELDPNSDAGLGGTSEDVFGPLVRLQAFLFKWCSSCP